MTKSENTRVYARALYDLALASDSVDAVGSDLAKMAEVSAANPSLADALEDVSLPAEKKAAILLELFSDVRPEALGLALVVFQNAGVSELTALVSAYDKIASAERNIVVAEVTTAKALSEALRASIQEKLSANVGKPVVIRERVDEALLGGIRINIDGRVLDGSLAKQLSAVKTALTSSVGGEA